MTAVNSLTMRVSARHHFAMELQESDAILSCALERLNVPVERRSGFSVTDRGDFLRVVLPDRDVIDLEVAERLLNVGGYATALVRELEDRGMGRMMSRR